MASLGPLRDKRVPLNDVREHHSLAGLANAVNAPPEQPAASVGDKSVMT